MFRCFPRAARTSFAGGFCQARPHNLASSDRLAHIFFAASFESLDLC